MEKSVSFDKSLLLPSRDISKISPWDETLKAWDAKKFEEAIYKVIDFANYDARKKYGNKEQTEFNVPHGSVVVQIKIEDAKLKIKAPFLRLPEKNKVAMLRQVAQTNFSEMVLAQIKLEGDDMNFYYETPVELCEPYKIYYTLKDICVAADDLDDVFVDKFQAIRLVEPEITPFDAAKSEMAFLKFQNYLKEAQEYVTYFESKRWLGYAWDMLAVTFHKIEYYCCPQGKLRTDLEKYIKELSAGSQIPLHEKVEKAKAAIIKMRAIGLDEFKTYLYISEKLVPTKWNGDLKAIQEFLQRHEEGINKDMNGNNYMGATLFCQYVLTHCLYAYYLDQKTQEYIEYHLLQASQKEWKESSEILYTCVTNILEDDIDTKWESESAVAEMGDINNYMNDYMKNAMSMVQNMFGKLTKK